MPFVSLIFPSACAGCCLTKSRHRRKTETRVESSTQREIILSTVLTADREFRQIPILVSSDFYFRNYVTPVEPLSENFTWMHLSVADATVLCQRRSLHTRLFHKYSLVHALYIRDREWWSIPYIPHTCISPYSPASITLCFVPLDIQISHRRFVFRGRKI